METDVAEYAKYILNVRLSKFLGLFRVIGRPSRGRDKFHLSLCLAAVASAGLMSVGLLGVCENVEYNPFYALMPLVVIQNVLFGCYKFLTLTRRSGVIRGCLDVTREDFGGDGVRHRTGPFRRFRARSLRITNVIFVSSVVALVNTTVPLVLLPLRIAIEKDDGTVESYRFNVLNLVYPVTGDTYNRWYYAFFAYETFVASAFMLFTNMFDSFMIPVCLAVCYHLEVVALNYGSLGCDERPESDGEMLEALHYTPRSFKKAIQQMTAIQPNVWSGGADKRVLRLRHVNPSVQNPLTKTMTSKTYHRTKAIEDIKTILVYHQKINQKLSDFYSIVRPIIVVHIMLCTITTTLIFFVNMVYIDSAEYRFQGLLSLAAVLYFIIQLLIPCYFFGLVEDKKKSINFAIYKSNWTEMDLEYQKLILLAMRMNNANTLQMRITPNKVVNLELFKGAIHTCYSVLSVMAKTRNRK